MPEPIKIISISKDELLERYQSFLIEDGGKPKDMDPKTRDEYYVRLGVMFLFAETLFTPTK